MRSQASCGYPALLVHFGLVRFFMAIPTENERNEGTRRTESAARRGRVFAQRKTERPAGRNAERADGDFVGNPAQDQSREDTEPEPAFDHRHDRVIVHRAKLHVRLELVAL